MDEQRWRLLAENSTDFVLLAAPDGSLEWASPSVTRLLGWAPEDMVGRSLGEFLHPDDLPTLARVRTAVTAGDSVTAEGRIRHRDGEYRWYAASVRPVHDDHGAFIGRVAGFRDIQAEVEARAALEASRQRFARMFRDHHAVMLLIEPESGAIVDANEAAADFYGYPRETLTTMSISELNVLPPDEVRRRRLEAAADHRTHFVFPHRRADGTIRTVEVQSSPIEDGDRLLLFSIVRDVTDAHQARQDLTDSEQRYRLLAENASDVVVKHDMAGTIEWVSPSVTEVLGWPVDALVGRPMAQIVHPDDVAALRPRQHEVIASGATVGTAEFRAATADGAWRWVGVRARILTGPDGRPVGAVESLRDIEGEVTARRALADSERRFRLAMESAPIGMAVVDADRRFLQVNPALCRMLGRDEAWLLEHRVPDVLHPDDDDKDVHLHAEALAGGRRTDRIVLRMITAGGDEILVEHSAGVLRNESGGGVLHVSQFVDVTQAHRAQERLRFLAQHDALTSLANREMLTSHLDRVLSHPPRSGDRLGVLFIDVDNLKPVNDSYGHAVGDRLLVEIARRIADQVRRDDVVARISGDEFVVALAALHGTADAVDVAAKVQAAMAEPVEIEGHALVPSVSIGVALARDGDSVADLIRRADRALYRAKRDGRGRTATADEEDAPAR